MKVATHRCRGGCGQMTIGIRCRSCAGKVRHRHPNKSSHAFVQNRHFGKATKEKPCPCSWWMEMPADLFYPTRDQRFQKPISSTEVLKEMIR